MSCRRINQATLEQPPESVARSCQPLQFEAQFLAAMTTYYEAGAAAQLQARDVPSYLQHVRTRLQQEEQRVVHYLHLGTRKPLLQVALNDAVANPNPNPDPSPTPRP